MREVQIKPAAPMTVDDTLLILPEGTGYKFDAGMDIQVGIENMRVLEVNGDVLTVERGRDGSIVRAHSGEDSILIGDQPTLGEFLTSTNWAPQIGQFGVLPLLTATLLTSLVGLAVAIPLGIGSAIFLSEYAPPKLRNTLKPILEILAGVPTVVYGFFALTFVTPVLLQGAFGQQVQFYNMLSAGLVIGILITPLISSMSEDALSAVPRALREASYGLGATRLETTIKVVIPAAMSGLSAALIIATSRAVGETMIVAVAAGAGPNFTLNLFQGAETMTGHISRISGGDLSYNSIDYNSIFAIGLLLFVMTLGLNLVSSYISRRLREAY
jgi:phosphate transport system permease protein